MTNDNITEMETVENVTEEIADKAVENITMTQFETPGIGLAERLRAKT